MLPGLASLRLSSLVLFATAACFGCSSSTASDAEFGAPGGGSPGGPSAAVPGPTPGPSQQGQGGDGQLTAGAWDDVANPEVFASFTSSFEQAQHAPDTGGATRVVIALQGPDGSPVSGARVTVSSGATPLLSAPAGTDGRLLLVPAIDHLPASGQLTVSVDRPGHPTFTTPAPQGNAWTISVPDGAFAPPPALDLAFVVDTTGSMGDELAYLQNEIANIAADVHAQFPGVDIRYGLVVYRDIVDPYVTRTFDFTSQLSDFQGTLRAQNASGGGDYPEEMEKGLAQMNQLSWRDGNVARVAFLVADAPPHPEDVHEAFDEMNHARLAGVRLYAIAGSGAAEDAEFVLRSGAQLTAARYLFLTDDSGLGDTHEIPHIPCYDVEHLRPLVARVLASELSGARVPAKPEDVLRSVGSPDANGVCAMQDGKQAFAF